VFVSWLEVFSVYSLCVDGIAMWMCILRHGPFVFRYQKLKLKRACRIIGKPNSLIHNITFNGTRLRKWIHNGRRVGRPRMNWAEETVKELWDDIKKEMPGLLKYMAFDDSNQLIMDIIKEHAKRNTKGTPINYIP
jgi:hypothetical protein